MPRSSSLASVKIEVAEQPQFSVVPDPDSPFHILVIGDFSGGAGRIRKPVPIDRDNFDEVLALFAPEIQLHFAGNPVPLRFNEIDDFHPDRLFHRLPPFQALRDLRQRISEGLISAPAEAPPHNMSGADLLRSMMGDSSEPAAAAPARSQWDRMLHELVAPYAEPKPDPRQPQYLKQTDAAITGEMRAVLHHPAFQDLEAAWRGLYFLTRRLETGEMLKLYVLDLPQAELTTNDGMALLRRIAVDETTAQAGAQPWSLIAALHYFGPDDESALLQVSAIARQAGAPFIAGLAPEVVGLTSTFEHLRRSTDARWIGLAMPRFLVRMPYGAECDSIEEFEFEEMDSSPRHEHYLWTNPAIACAYLLGDTFSRYGWQMRPGSVSQVDGLPLHVYRHDGEAAVKPCAEVLLTEDAVEILLDCGFMPLVSIKDTDRVQLARFQSVAHPAAPLAGRWT